MYYFHYKNKSQTIRMNRLQPSTIGITLICVLLSLQSNGSPIVDFEYTEYSHKAQTNGDPRKQLAFKPLTIDVSKMNFHQICELYDQFHDQKVNSDTHVEEQNIDSYLSGLKDQFFKLLTVTSKLKSSREKITHLDDLINRTRPVRPDESKLSSLQSLQKNLRSIDQKIWEKDQTLQTQLSQWQTSEGLPYSDNSPEILKLDFNIELLRHKIDYLNDLERKSTDHRSRNPEVNYEPHFGDLEKQFNNESNLIQRIDTILRKKDDLAKLRREEKAKEASIQALDLYIEEAEKCEREKEQMRQEFKDRVNIKHLIEELKKLKEKEGEDNIYCEGVVKKLTNKIKGMLKYYDIVTSCALDLPNKLQDLRKDKEELREIRDKIAELEKVENFDEFESIMKDQKHAIDIVYDQIKAWKAREFSFKPEDVQALVAQSQTQLNGLIERKRELREKGTGSSSSAVGPSAEIVTLINDIKRLKYEYCLEFSKYDDLATKLWSKAYQYQSEANLKIKLEGLFREQEKKYQKLQSEFLEIREVIFTTL